MTAPLRFTITCAFQPWSLWLVQRYAKTTVLSALPLVSQYEQDSLSSWINFYLPAIILQVTHDVNEVMNYFQEQSDQIHWILTKQMRSPNRIRCLYLVVDVAPLQILKGREVRGGIGALFVILSLNLSIAPFSLRFSIQIRNLTLVSPFSSPYLPVILPLNLLISSHFLPNCSHSWQDNLLIQPHSETFFLYLFFDKLAHCLECFYYK